MTSNREIFQIAIEHHRAGNLGEAERLYRELLQGDPANANVLHLMGTIAMQTGKSIAAIDFFQRAIEREPLSIESHQRLADAFRISGDMQSALVEYQHVADLLPEDVDAWNNVGATRQAIGDLDSAADAYREAIRLRPQFIEAYNNLGLVYLNSRRLSEAIQTYQQALQLAPHSPQTHFQIANAFKELGGLESAIEHYRKVIDIQPDFYQAYHNLGVVHQETKQYDAAITVYQIALQIYPSSAETYKNLGSAYQAQWRVDEAMEAYEKALQLDPDYAEALDYLIELRRGICAWDKLTEQSIQLSNLIDRIGENIGPSNDRELIRPFPLIAIFPVITAEQQLRCNRRWSNRTRIFARSRSSFEFSDKAQRSVSAKIKLGYLSGDFRTHAVAFMLPELFEEHDRERFEVFAYSTSPDDQSLIRKRLVAGVDCFREIESLPFDDAVRCIAGDEIDILIDLQGYTGRSRSDILALRPAPIQVSYIGFPGTMGADFIDYILADEYVLPSDQQPYFTEQIVHLPGCYQVNDSRHEISSSRPTRQRCDLPDDSFVFCSFNTCYKITPEMFDVWMRLLRSVPQSVLWLPEQQPATTQNLRREAKIRNVAPERLVFAKQLPIAEHLARQVLADLFLDSFPYNGHATTSIALRMGVPTVTLSGNTFASRVAGSLLRAVGLSEWIAKDFREYETMAIRLATDSNLLSMVRKTLQNNLIGCSLYDGRVFARNVEMAYSEMWQIYRRGDAPCPITINR
ncbi:MAG: tetratricopeptide repeat protein [Pirellulaceae bacterium]|nr:tetratricopeptide repeat protein [Pirellulaceae bacterium]